MAYTAEKAHCQQKHTESAESMLKR